jgi:1A family penicillin-binding protein
LVVTGNLLLLAAALPLPAPQALSGSLVYDFQDRPLLRLDRRLRLPVSLSEVSPHLRRAILAAEDSRFYRHFGLDPLGVARAAWVNLRAGRVVEGGSTITQQLARNLYLGQERTLSRKLRELFLALQLEARYSKDEILEMYLNDIYLGNGAYGVEAASRLYFGKSARELSLSQAALLAGIIRAPETYNPLRYPERAQERKEVVLQRMVRTGWISSSEAQKARRERLRFAGSARLPTYPHFVDYLMREVRLRYPGLERDLLRRPYRIYTSLDPRMQEAAEEAVRSVPEGVEAALVALEPSTGYIRALVGGREPKGGYNRALDARRQPGSAFKPFLYAALLQDGHTVVERQMCEPISFPGRDPEHPYTPADFTQGGRRPPYHFRPLAMREALEISDNVVTVRWVSLYSPSRLAAFARSLGIESPLKPELPLALGASEVTPLEMARAYAAFANGGFRIRPLAVRRLEDPRGRVLLSQEPVRDRVLDPGVAYIITDILKGVITRGTARNLAGTVTRPAAGKTGTTDRSDNAWFIGYTPDLVAAVWVGKDLPAPLPGFGSTLAGPVWAAFMNRALEGKPPSDFPMPPNVRRLAVSATDGLLPNPYSPVTEELFLRGTEPRLVSPLTARPLPPAQALAPLAP